MYDEILYEVTDPVATITLNRPDRLNAFTTHMGDEVRTAMGRAAKDPAVVGIVLTGAGRGFCAGADLKVLQGVAGGDAEAEPEMERSSGRDLSEPDVEAAHVGEAWGDDLAGTYTYLLSIPKPVIAAINGPCAGMAVPIVTACDLRFMAEGAVITTAFSQRGLIAEWGLSWLLPRLVGPSVALDLMFSSRKVDAEECERIGLVNRALPADELLPHAIGYVEELARTASPASLAVMKRQVYQQLHAGLGPAEREAISLMVESFGRPDFAEGVSSYLQKRPPKFGRLPA